VEHSSGLEWLERRYLIMSISGHVIDVTEADFEYEVINFSQNTPVVVDFWAEWCVPCKSLSPILTRLAEEARGGFRLAKVNIDDNPNLAIRYGVRSIPNVKAFLNGQVVGEFAGLIPEPKILEFLSKLVPDEAGLAVEKGSGLMVMRRWVEAEEIFREVLQDRPENPPALLGLAKSLLGQGHGREAQMLLRGFPPSREYANAELLLPLAASMAAYERGELKDENPSDAAYRNAVRLAAKGNVYAALDGLLDILRQDKRYRGGVSRQVYLGLLELLGEVDPETRQYRAELTNLLF
jgi:putative thioredoxin